MKTLLIREIPDEVHAFLAADAERNRRSKEKHALYLIESSLAARAADTCSELVERIWQEAAPQIEEREIDAHLASRGRRSPRS